MDEIRLQFPLKDYVDGPSRSMHICGFAATPCLAPLSMSPDCPIAAAQVEVRVLNDRLKQLKLKFSTARSTLPDTSPVCPIVAAQVEVSVLDARLRQLKLNFATARFIQPDT